MNKDEIAIIVPAYNEEKNIEKTIDSLKKEGYKSIIVIDDGSRDKTYEISKSKNINVLKHIVNLGQGAALQTGIDYAILKNNKIIITFDGDGQHNAKEIEELVLPIINKTSDICLGSRFLKKQEIPLLRKIILKGGVFIIWAMYGLKLSDAHNGFRALSKSAAKKIKLPNGMEHASEIINQIKRKKIKHLEVPVTITYTKESLKKGQSNMNSFKILFKMIWEKLR